MSASIDQQFIEYIVKAIVGNPDAVKIERTIDEKGVLLQLTVDGEDLGRVIGKRGSGAQALRTLLRALGTKNDARYNLKIVDVNGDRPARKDDEQPEEKSDEKTDDQEIEETPVAEEPAEQSDTIAFADDDDEEEVDDEADSIAARTRKELADLDDLDI